MNRTGSTCDLSTEVLLSFPIHFGKASRFDSSNCSPLRCPIGLSDFAQSNGRQRVSSPYGRKFEVVILRLFNFTLISVTDTYTNVESTSASALPALPCPARLIVRGGQGGSYNHDSSSIRVRFTAVLLPFDCSSTRYDHSTTFVTTVGTAA